MHVNGKRGWRNSQGKTLNYVRLILYDRLVAGLVSLRASFQQMALLMLVLQTMHLLP